MPNFVINFRRGYSSTGLGRILEIPIGNIHQRTPLFLGSVEQVSALESYIGFYQKSVVK